MSQQSNHQQMQAFCVKIFHFFQFHNSIQSLVVVYGARSTVRVGGHLFPARIPFAQCLKLMQSKYKILATKVALIYGMAEINILFILLFYVGKTK